VSVYFTPVRFVSSARLIGPRSTPFIAIFLIVSGAFRVISALVMQFPDWGWALLNGGVTLLLGIIINRQLSEAALWVIGLFVGIEMLFNGWAQRRQFRLAGSLYQSIRKRSCCCSIARRRGIDRSCSKEYFKVLIHRSRTAMLPYWPMAPKPGRMPRR
jgi:hypothetical protein